MVVIMSKLKTLKIKEETHSRLAELGRKGESFDDILKRILDFVESARAERLDRRLEKVEELGRLAQRRWKLAETSGRLERTERGWRMNPDAG